MNGILEPQTLSENVLSALADKATNVAQILSFWVKSADLKKLAGTAGNIYESVCTQDTDTIQNSPSSQIEKIQQLQSTIDKFTK